MNQNNLFGKIGILISFSLLFLLATYFGKNVDYLGVTLFSVGVLLGMALLELDEKIIFKYYDPENKNLATRSLLFLISLPPLGLFLLTSTGSIIGVGMFLGIISILSLEFFLLRTDLASFQKRYLYQLKRNISLQEHEVFTLVFIFSSLLYSFLVIFAGR